VQFDSLGAISYSPSILTMAVSVAVCELFSVKAFDLGNWVRGHSRSLKMLPFDRPYATFYWSAIVTKKTKDCYSKYLTCDNFRFQDSNFATRSVRNVVDMYVSQGVLQTYVQ